MRLRGFRRADLAAYARITREAGAADGAVRAFTRRDAEEYLAQPNLNPERDCFLAEVDGHAAGYVLVVPELVIGRSIIEGAVAPRYRRQGIGRRLLDHGVAHSRTLGAERAHTSVSSEGTAARRLFEAAGFVEARRQLHMRLDLEDLVAGDGPTEHVVRHLRDGEEAVMTDLQNRAFTGSWGFAPNTPEEMAYRLRMRGSRFEDALILEVEGRPAAYCWTKMEARGNDPGGVIWMIGVDPAMRGLGLGRAMLLASVDYLARQGARSVKLDVYADNAPAVNLYEATGFRRRGEIIFYEKRL
ncbi:MAG: GNAT family N-acetyltransferase [Dehalococcoidia bacterium]